MEKFMLMDTNGDGQLSQEELLEELRVSLERSDKD